MIYTEYMNFFFNESSQLPIVTGDIQGRSEASEVGGGGVGSEVLPEI
jgi:hypothetical protein